MQERRKADASGCQREKTWTAVRKRKGAEGKAKKTTKKKETWEKGNGFLQEGEMSEEKSERTIENHKEAQGKRREKGWEEEEEDTKNVLGRR